MPITGAHALLHSSKPDELRALLKDVFSWDHVNAGDGWLILGLPSGEIAVHPADKPSHELTLMCDKLDDTIAELSAKGVAFKGQPVDEGWGIVITMILPGEVEMLLYEPRHKTAL